MNQKRPPAAATAELRRLINGYQVSQAISVAAELRIADLLVLGPMHVRDLASATDADEAALYRLLRALASVGVFTEHAGRTFGLSDLAQALVSSAPGSLAGWAVQTGRPYYREAWGHLGHSIRTGEIAFEAIRGESVWEWRAARPEESAIFDRAMESLSGAVIAMVAGAYDFGAFSRIVDVGGGTGAFLAAILQRFPSPRGVLFDQPHVVAGAPELLQAAGVLDRCDVLGGDFFNEVPAGGDAYMMKSVLHDWDDARAANILTSIHKACPESAVLLVVDRIVDPPNEGSEAKFSDLNMLAVPGGRERTVSEWSDLFTVGGFRLTGATPFAGSWAVIEGAVA